MKPSCVPSATPDVTETSDVDDSWCCEPLEDSHWVSYHPSTSSSAPECSSREDKSTTSNGPILHQPHDNKWWLLMQPDLQQQLNALESEISAHSAGYMTKTTKFCEDNHQFKEFDANACIKDDTNSSLLPPSNCHSWDLESDNVNCLAASQAKKLFPDVELPWMGSEKTEPWWRSMSKDELASLVAQKSLKYIENCDLPRPQLKHSREEPSNCVVHRKLIPSTVDLISEKGLSTWNIPTSSSIDERDRTARDHGCIHDVLDGPCSCNHSETLDEGQTNLQKHGEDMFSMPQLLEALCHSQTRARKAEEAAQKAFAEKEHIVTLFFRQASQLFAYRQWLQMLQLESVYIQIKNGTLPTTDLLPEILSWVPQKGKTKTKGAPPKTRKRRHGKCRSAVALAVGFGLVGTGLLLGWTMGWLLFS